MRSYLLCLLLGITLRSWAAPQEPITVASPNGQLKINVFIQQDAAGNTQLQYDVVYAGKPVILRSKLDLAQDNHLIEAALALPVDSSKNWCDDLVLKQVQHNSRDTVWAPLYGERNKIRDHYNDAVIELEKSRYISYKMQLQVRAYDEGIAFRYFFPQNEKGVYYHILQENTSFTLPPATMAWYAPHAQAAYRELPLKDWPDESERPLTLSLPNGLWVSLCEAGMVDYARTKFRLSAPNTLQTAMYDGVDVVTPFGTPWRVIMVAEKPGRLLEHNDIILNLNEPNAIQDPQWIKPGKIVRDMTLSNEGARSWIDFAAAHNMQYLLFDWKWYGPALNFSSDATKVVVDMDLPGIIKYAAGKGVGIFLYVNHQALQKQGDQLFPVYKSWGVKGVKFGFVEVGTQRWSSWVHELVRKAADNQLLVNIHDEYRPTGYSRTYPNLITQEGIRGNEEMPDATHNTILPFTRGIAGAGDYTICYYSKRIKTTHAHQLALGVVCYSPLQTLFWYDKAADYHQEPEITFFEQLPTVWDDTRVIDGTPGHFVSMARRSGQQWFIGTITNNDARTVRIPLDFLDPKVTYQASIYEDDPQVKTATQVKITERRLKAGDVLTVKLSPSGGQAVWLKPVE